MYLASLTGLVLLTAAGGRLGVAAGSLLVLGVTASTVYRLRRDGLDAPGLYAALAGVMFGGLSLLWLGTPAIPAPGIRSDHVSAALIVVAAGLAAAGAGAAATGRAKPRAPLRFNSDNVPGITVIALLFLVGAVGLAATLAFGAAGYQAAGGASGRVLPFAQALIQAGGLGSLVVTACALIAFGTGSRPHMRLLPIMVVVQVAGGFAVGYKHQSVLPVLLCLLAYISCGNRLPRRTVAALVAGTALLLVPANLLYRQTLRDPVGGTTPKSGTPVRILEETVRYGTVRFRLIDHVALINARTPSVYSRPSGRRYTLLPALVLIPRAIWPDKPILNDGLEFSHTYWEVPVGVTTATPLTQPGDLLRNFGPVGVVLGLAGWGVLLGLLTAACRRWRSPRVEMLYLVSLMTLVVWVETDFPQLLAGALKTMATAGVVAWLLLPGRRVEAGHLRLADLLRRFRSSIEAAQGRRG